MRLLPVLVAITSLGFRAEPSLAAECELSPRERATIAQVKDAETLELTDIVRLIGAKTPQAPLGWRGQDPWPFVQEAQDAMTRLAMGADVELRFGGNQSDAERIARLSHSYQLVEGVVAEIGEVRGRLYLNFTQDWRTDFTIAVEPKDVASFAEASLDLKSLKGKRVRVRGWVQWRNGPMIVADHPEQIEILPEVKKTAGPAGEDPRDAGRLDDNEGD